MHLSFTLSTMIIICVKHLFVTSDHFMDLISISSRLVLKFSLKVHFILCNLTVSDISTLILVGFQIGDNNFVCASLLTIASLLEMCTTIIVLIKILKSSVHTHADPVDCTVYSTNDTIIRGVLVAGEVLHCVIVSGPLVQYKQQTHGLCYLYLFIV